MDMINSGNSEPLEAIIEAWHAMYPVAYGPWEKTGEPCPKHPNCRCDGEQMVRTVLHTFVN